MYVFETFVIVFYLIFFILNSPIVSNFTSRVLGKIKFFNEFNNSLLLFMSWGMFERVPPDQHNVKIIIEKKDGEKLIFYLKDQLIKNLIPELNLKDGSLSGLINNYNHFYFMNIFFKERFGKIFENEIKFISIYKVIFNGESNKTLIPNLSHPLSTLLYQYTYDD